MRWRHKHLTLSVALFRVSLDKIKPNQRKRDNKMKLKKLASNMTELTLSNGDTVLYSYDTPVAGWDETGAYRTNKFFSQTTTKHINKYLGGKDIGRQVSHELLDARLG